MQTSGAEVIRFLRFHGFIALNLCIEIEESEDEALGSLMTVGILTWVFKNPSLRVQDSPCWVSGIYPKRPCLNIDLFV